MKSKQHAAHIHTHGTLPLQEALTAAWMRRKEEEVGCARRPRGTAALAVRASAALGRVHAQTADSQVVVQNILFPQGPGGKNNMQVVTRVLEKHIKIFKKVVL